MIFHVCRYGQKKPVFAYRLLAHGTMEEKIYKRQVNNMTVSVHWIIIT
jgi:transcriptional regulator ATRX